MNTENSSINQNESRSSVSEPISEQPKEPVSVNQNEVPPATTSDSPTPLSTYDAMNADAPVVTSNVVQNRLAKIAAENRAKQLEEQKKNQGDSPENNEGETAERRPSGGRPGDRGTQRNRPRSGDRSNDDSDKSGRKRDRFDSPKKDRFENFPREPISKVPVPNLRQGLSDDLEQEFAELFQDKPLEDLMGKSVDEIAGRDIFEDGSKVNCRIVSIMKDVVFVELGTRDQGVIPLKQFPEEEQPTVGQTLEAVITRFNAEEGLYDVSLPLAAAEVGDWSSLSKGLVVEARIVKSNKGGLECEIGKLRAFMPLGQIAPFRVENPEQFIGERWKCVITEVNPLRRNLVVSRRVLMEKEREELSEKLFAELEVGQVREGLVRNLIEKGAFVDLGGADGFVPIGAMSWERISHPSAVMKVGDKIKVTVTKIDFEAKRISLSFKDQALDPWNSIFNLFQEKTQTRGRVTNIMPFGAFVELAPGVEGLIHISELAYTRVNNVSEVLNVGEWVDVLILSIDPDKRKIALSIKKTQEDPRIAERAKRDEAEAAALAEEERKENDEVEAVREKIRNNQFKGELKGGVQSNSEGEKFGLNW